MIARARFIAWGALVLIVASCSDDGETHTLTRAQLLDPESCKDCHPKHYEEWSASMHAYATLDPVFLAMNKRGQDEAQIGDFCVKCHAPMALRENAIANFGDLTNVPKPLQGVTCYFCHNTVNVREPHNNANLDLANDTIMRGALGNPVDTPAHGVLDGKSKYHDRTLMDSAVMCGTCHDIETPHGFELERTFTEYQQSIQATSPLGNGFSSCVSCHMSVKQNKEPAASGFAGSPPVRDVHWHLFPAVDVSLTPGTPHQDVMRSAVENCELQVRTVSLFNIVPGNSLPGEPYNFSVQIEHVAGHNLPSGASADRRLWVEVVAYDENDQVVLESGRIADGELEEKPEDDPKHDPQFKPFRDYVLDPQGHETHMFWEAASLDTARSELIPFAKSNVPGSHTSIRSFTTTRPLLRPPPRIEIWLRLRPMGVDMLQDLVKSGYLDPAVIAKMPTYTVDHRVAVLNPDGRSYASPQPPAFIDGAECMDFEKLMYPLP